MYRTEVLPRFQELKAHHDMELQQRGGLQVQLTDHRKVKTQLTRDKKILVADYDRKHAELIRTIEVRDELERVQHNLRTNTDLADEVSTEIAQVRDGIKVSVEQHLMLSTRMESSTYSDNLSGVV